MDKWLENLLIREAKLLKLPDCDDPMSDNFIKLSQVRQGIHLRKDVAETRIVYRIENPNDTYGMWYTGDAVLKKRIHFLCPDGIAKDFPMPFSDLHRLYGHVWNSAGKSIENMNQWFTASDALSLFKHGFRLYEFETTMFQELEMETLFCRAGIINQREIPLTDVWDIDD